MDKNLERRLITIPKPVPVMIGSFTPNGVVGSTAETPGAILDSKGNQITADDYNRVYGSDGYTLNAWSRAKASEQETETTAEPKTRRIGFAQKIAIGLGSLATLVACGSKGGGTTPPAEKITLTFDVYNHILGKLTSFSKANIIPNSQVSIAMSSISGVTATRMGAVNLTSTYDVTHDDTENYFDPVMKPIKVRPAISNATFSVEQYKTVSYALQNAITGVDDKRMVIRKPNFGDFIAFTNTGTIVFTAPTSNESYTLYVFDGLEPNIFGDQVSYDWMDSQSANLYAGTNKYNLWRRDFDGQTGEERAWGGAPLPEIGNYPGVLDQLLNSIKSTDPNLNLGNIVRLPQGTSGTFSYGFGNS